ncbi:glycoside hydrolase family 43 protein [Humibacter ginsengisoli]
MSHSRTNPVIPGFHPDPSICRVGSDYYLTCSSFEYFPGLPVFHSTDLAHWTQIGNALDRPSQLALASAPSSGGIYAPTLRYHDGLFWIITTVIRPGGGNFVITATDAGGPWSEPIWLPELPGIDPDLVWDEGGTCWCTFAGIGQARISPRSGEVVGEPRQIWSGLPGAKAPEAPHLYHVGNWWYLIIAEGGTERGHSVSVARSRSVTGPFEACPSNPILTHRGTDHEIQNTGHADLVQAVDGSWWMVLLAVRPQGGTPGWHVLGRETFLAEVSWVDEWPVVGDLSTRLSLPVTSLDKPSVSEARHDFEAPELDPGWVSVRERSADHVTVAERKGWLTLRARGRSLDASDIVFVGRRQRWLRGTVKARIDASDGAGGLGIRLDEQHHYEIETGDGRVRVAARIGSVYTEVASAPLPNGVTTLVLQITDPKDDGPKTGPDTILFGVEDGAGAVQTLASLDGRYLSTEVAGGFTGRVIGMYAAEGTVHFDWYEEVDADAAGNSAHPR